MRMHDMQMIHSDVKTTNFFVHRDGRIFLGDYSLSHVNLFTVSQAQLV